MSTTDLDTLAQPSGASRERRAEVEYHAARHRGVAQPAYRHATANEDRVTPWQTRTIAAASFSPIRAATLRWTGRTTRCSARTPQPRPIPPPAVARTLLRAG